MSKRRKPIRHIHFMGWFKQIQPNNPAHRKRIQNEIENQVVNLFAHSRSDFIASWLTFFLFPLSFSLTLFSFSIKLHPSLVFTAVYCTQLCTCFFIRLYLTLCAVYRNKLTIFLLHIKWSILHKNEKKEKKQRMYTHTAIANCLHYRKRLTNSTRRTGSIKATTKRG